MCLNLLKNIDIVIQYSYNTNAMKKDIVYSIRMSILVREALKRAAKKERRTVASLLDKIILDYLEEQRYLLPHETVRTAAVTREARSPFRRQRLWK